jgi:hypothetical protein
MYIWHKLILLLPLVACTPDYPMDRPGTWNASMSNSNDANLRAMVANPHDLTGGTGQDASVGAEVAPPVARVLAGKRYPLPALSASGLNIVAEPQQQGNTNPGPNQ